MALTTKINRLATGNKPVIMLFLLLLASLYLLSGATQNSLLFGRLYSTLLVIIIFYLVLGCFMETFSMLITTAPLIVPIVAGLDFGLADAHETKIWFGILLIILLEAALITPPIGVNLYVVQGVRGKGAMMDVIVGSLPFVITMFVMIALIIAFPGIALWATRLF